MNTNVKIADRNVETIFRPIETPCHNTAFHHTGQAMRRARIKFPYFEGKDRRFPLSPVVTFALTQLAQSLR